MYLCLDQFFQKSPISCNVNRNKKGQPRRTAGVEERVLPSFHDQEGRKGSDEVVPGPSVFPSREPSVSGNSCGRIKGRDWFPCAGAAPCSLEGNT